MKVVSSIYEIQKLLTDHWKFESVDLYLFSVAV